MVRGRAVGPDPPAMRDHDAATDGEAETGTTDPAGASPLAAIEAFEQARELIRRDAKSLIDDAHHDLAVGDDRPYVDAAAVGRVLDRVVEQVVEDLLDPVRISAHCRQRPWHHDAEAVGFTADADPLHGRADEPIQPHRRSEEHTSELQ